MAARLTWILVALAVALYGIVNRPLVLGLDLKGGVTMRYELQPSDTTAPDADLDAMIDATVETLRARINSYGIKESVITRQGEREVVIELPGSSEDEADSIKSIVSRVGKLEFRLVMARDGTEDDLRNDLVVADEDQQLADLLALPENVGKLPEDIDVTSLDVRGPDVLYRWYPYSDKLIAEKRGQVLSDDVEIASLVETTPLTSSDYELVKIDLLPSHTFTGGDIQIARQDMDNRGNPSVGITMRPDRASEFGDWTEPNKGRAMILLLDGRVAESPASINDRLEGRFIIRSGGLAGFTSAEIKDYLTVIKSGSLQMKPRLLFGNTVGPSLGEASIQAGTFASLAGFIAILLFMLLYYRVHGVIAALCLFVNMTLLTGILMFLGATLTLPGIAGLVLTLGMAVDANILIFERFREEADRAKSVGQAVKLGFEKAFSTIVDANVTTFVTAFILYKVGTGPVRGFAVILMLGILTSVFSVLVFGRLLYDYLVEKGFTNMAMGRIIKAETHIAFMRQSRKALTVSSIAVVLSLAAFLIADRDKFGLDFLGGYKAQVRLAEASTQGDVKDVIDVAFPDAQVISVIDDTGQGQRQFVIKIKARPGENLDEDEGLKERYQLPLKRALAGRILPDFVSDLTIEEDTEAVLTTLSGTLHFERSADPVLAVTPEKVADHIGFLANLETSAAPDGGVAFSGSWARVDVEDQLVVQRLRGALATTDDLPPPSEPFIESTSIGSRVGTELQDSAIQAILLSFVAIVLYIRVRFREYRYGIAAIVALFHDVSITLGVVALMHFSGIVDVEIDLAMIAAFLTIIGYSLNDTIVVFDRVRENLPRLTGKTFPEVLDISINQTLSRTLLTSMTTLTVLVVIFIFNYGRQNVLEGFSFAMIIGVVVGTYSSIFVASPILTLLEKDKPGGRSTASAPTSGKGGRKTQGVPA